MPLLEKIKHLIIPHQGNDFKPHLIRHNSLHLYSLLAVVLKIGLTALLFILYPSMAHFSSLTADNVVKLVNEIRIEQNLAPLDKSSVLEQAANLKADDMVTKNYFAHTSPEGLNPWHWFKEAGYVYTFAGENLGMGFTDAESIVKAWMDSEKHRKNILNPEYKEIGIGVKTGQINNKQTTVAVQLFGTTFVKSQLASASPVSNADTVAEEELTPAPVRGEEIVVEIKSKDSESVWAKIILWGQRSFYGILIIITFLLALNIVVRIKIQHAPIIFHSLILIILIISILIFHPHFLESAFYEQMVSVL